MTLVSALLATKLTSNSTIENFKDSMILDNKNEVSSELMKSFKSFLS